MKKFFRKRFENEKNHLQGFPVFDPVFLDAYGRMGVLLSILLGMLIYIPVVAYYFPENNNYDEEVFYLLLGFVGIGGFILAPLFSSYAVRFVLNLIDLVVWHTKMKLFWTKTTKAMIWLVPLFFIVGIPISFHPQQDVWGWFVCFLGFMLFVLFVHFLWLINYYLQRATEESQTPDGGTSHMEQSSDAY